MKESKGNGRKNKNVDQENEIFPKQNTVIEMKNAIYGLISRLDITEKKISELEVISIETSKTEIQ